MSDGDIKGSSLLGMVRTRCTECGRWFNIRFEQWYQPPYDEGSLKLLYCSGGTTCNAPKARKWRWRKMQEKKLIYAVEQKLKGNEKK